MIYVAIEPYANLSNSNTVLPHQSAAPASDSTQTAAPAFVGGNTGRNNGLYALGAVVAPNKIDFQLRDRKTSTRSGIPSYLRRARFRSTRS